MSIEKLYARVTELEERFALQAGDRPYSERLVALFDAFEEALAAEQEAEQAAEAELGALGDQISRLQEMVGEAAESSPPSGSVEEALANIESALEGGGAAPKDDFAAFQEKVKGTNISETTLLATDYLNHFNEIVMTLEMVPMMPELLDEAKAWQPKSYQQHFADSTFSDKDLAVEAYNHVPDQFRKPFETTISQMDQLVAATIERLEKEMADGDMERSQETATSNSKMIQRLIDVASGIIHGSEVTMDQGEIDSFLF